MFQIELNVRELDANKEETGRSLSKTMSWPLVPRQDELLSLKGNTYTIVDVLHRIDEEPGTIEVGAQGPEGDFKTLINDPSWKRMGF